MNKILFVILVSMLSLSSFAERPKYNQGTFEYVSIEPDGSTDDLTGFNLSGELRLKDHPVLLVGDYEKTSKNSLDFTFINIGGRYILQYENDIDFLLGGGFYKAELDNGSNTSDDSEIGLVASIRKTLDGQPIQFEAGLRLLDGDIDLGGNMQYFVDKQISVKGSIQFGDAERFALGASYWF